MFPFRKPFGYDKVDQDEGNLRELVLESIRTTFPRGYGASAGFRFTSRGT